MNRETIAQIKLIGLKIALKMHDGNYTNKEGKVSSTELLKTADEINKWLLEDFKDLPQEWL
ncbi:hypothetical protein MG290_01920 [Flavobacterium sp. CBA20B-1]|uniref:hypothetical protein n=1 Tax=unclassified Flavobacterium TaxID=196869 RepID=UPI002223F18C|nr:MULTISPECIES: hypothetical protein [unclassified Flavobacterium]WCM42453.1 hypothetical protein MG290_01920 [Flavobacterium sp. CBA20B-1]